MGVPSVKEKRNFAGVFHWEREDVLMLIRLHSEKEPIFNKPGIKKKDVWAMIGDEFQAKGFNVTSAQCEQKWKNITKYYRDTVDHNYFNNIKKTCPFFAELAAIYPYDPKDKQSRFISYLSQMSNSITGQPQSTLKDLPNNLVTNTVTASVNDSSNGFFSDLSPNVCVSDNQNTSSEQLAQVAIKQEVLDSVDIQPPMCSLLPTSPLETPTQQTSISPPQSHPPPQQTLHFVPPSSLSLVNSLVNEEPINSLSSMMIQYSPETVQDEFIQQLSPAESQTFQLRHQPELVENTTNSLHSIAPSSSHHEQSSVPSSSVSTSHIRKRFRDNLHFSNSSLSNSHDSYSQRRKCLRRPISTPNSTVDMLKQMNEERRREHRELISTLKQQHREYLKQEELNQSLLSTLIGYISKK